jgi:prepilin-type N-terminal cleavage/methylation domain-containing protein
MRGHFKIKSDAGFTLTEVMVTVAIFAIVLTAVYAAFNSQFQSYQTQEDVVTVQSDIRSAAEMLTRDIRNAGFGIPSGSGVTTIAAASASSITLNVAGTTSSTYITTTNYTVSGGGPFTYVIPVFSTTGFSNVTPYNTYNAIDIRTKTVELGNTAGDRITAVNPGNNTLTVTGTLSQNFVLNVGDIIVSPGYAPVTYSLAAPVFTRTDAVTGSAVTLSNNIQSFALSYIMTDGTTTTNPGTLSNIAAVNFTINGQSSQKVSNINGQKRTRTVNAIVALRNF